MHGIVKHLGLLVIFQDLAVEVLEYLEIVVLQDVLLLMLVTLTQMQQQMMDLVHLLLKV